VPLLPTATGCPLGLLVNSGTNRLLDPYRKRNTMSFKRVVLRGRALWTLFTTGTLLHCAHEGRQMEANQAPREGGECGRREEVIRKTKTRTHTEREEERGVRLERRERTHVAVYSQFIKGFA
jgi:hypothetical protein